MLRSTDTPPHVTLDGHRDIMIADRVIDWANIVRERRTMLGATQADVAAELGTSRQWVSNFENGRSTSVAELATVLRLLAVLDLTALLTTQPADA